MIYRFFPRVISLFLLAAGLWCGCSSLPQSPSITTRGFQFERDTIAFANELVWEYGWDERGHWRGHKRDPKPDYTHHCFVMARCVRQFFLHAQFDPFQPAASPQTYRRLVRQVVRRNPRKWPSDRDKIIMPGFPHLRAFSKAHPEILKAECGGAWQSYSQRGNWRMIFPLTRRHQAKTAEHLKSELRKNQPLVVHLVRFPQLTINHAVVLYDAVENEGEMQYATYDPNRPEAPTQLTYQRSRRTFQFRPTNYFPGGRVDVYEIYQGFCY